MRTFNRDWLFCYDPEPEPLAGRAEYEHDPADFHAIALPHTWHTYETTGQLHPFIHHPAESDNIYWWQGWGWYRKKFTIDTRHSDRRIFLEFDGVQKFCRIYCNGTFLKDHPGGYNSFAAEMTNAIKWGEENVIAVAVSARPDDDMGGIPPMNAGNFNTYGGMYRDVRLVLKNPVHIPFQGSADHEGGTLITTPVIDHEHAIVRILTHLRNDRDLQCKVTVLQRILDPKGSLVAEFGTTKEISPHSSVSVSLDSSPIKKPQLWSPDSPALYQVLTVVMEGDSVLDEISSPLGFRWFRWDNDTNALYLNDERVRINGMNRHQEYPWLGDAIPKDFHEADLRDMRENLGINFARWCHYTQDNFVYDWCDRNGIIVCEEAPNIKNLPSGPDVQRRQVVEMIRRDRNHPCILMWSMGNETDNAADGRWARSEDDTRIIHYRKVSGPTPECDHSHDQLDMENLLRCTVRGWWEDDAMDTECEPLPGDHESGQVSGTEAWQHAAARLRDGCIRGRIDDVDTVAWIYADHGADREYKHCPLKHINPKGWVDAYRQPKQIYWLWQANRTDRLMVHARNYWWRPLHTGTRRDIVVDSNGETVRLYVGDELVGEKRPGPHNFFSVVFKNVPVRPAELRAEARRGSQTATHITRMPSPPRALRLNASKKTVVADRASIALVRVDVIDERGTPVIGARPPLNWEVDGPGRLVGPAEMVSDINRREEMDGTMYTVTPIVMPVRSAERPGEITVKVSSPGLQPGRLVIKSCAPAHRPEDGIREWPVAEGHTERLQRQREDAGAMSRLSESIPLIYSDIRTDPSNREKIRRQLWREIGESDFLSESDPKAVELIEGLTELALESHGTLIADDVNFHLRRFAQKSHVQSEIRRGSQ